MLVLDPMGRRMLPFKLLHCNRSESSSTSVLAPFITHSLIKMPPPSQFYRLQPFMNKNESGKVEDVERNLEPVTSPRAPRLPSAPHLRWFPASYYIIPPIIIQWRNLQWSAETGAAKSGCAECVPFWDGAKSLPEHSPPWMGSWLVINNCLEGFIQTSPLLM